MGIDSSFSRWSRMKKGATITAVLILLYAIFGFLVAPSIFRSGLISNIADRLGRKATVKAIKVNPFVLSVTLKGFEMSEPGGERFLGFEELYVNFQLSSIFRRAYTFDEVRLMAPDGQVKVLPDGRLNVSDLLASRDQTQPAPDQTYELPPVLIFHLQIEQGRLTFSDLSRPTPFETKFFPIQLTLNNFTTSKESDSPYGFTATTGEGEILSWEGNFSVNPPSSRGRFELTGIKARTLWKYIQDQVHFEVTSGSIDLAGRYHVDASGEAVHVELIDGELGLTGLKLAEKGSRNTLVSVPLVSVQGATIDLIKRQAVLASVRSSSARFEGWLAPDGTFNYQTLFAMVALEDEAVESPGATDLAEVESPPWNIIVNEVSLENYGVVLEDRMLAKPVRLDLHPIKLNLKNVSNQKDSQAEISLALGVNKTATVKARGLAGIDPVSADLALHVTQLALRPFQPYVDSVAQIDLVRGTANLDGQLRYRDVGSGEPDIRYEGGLSIDGFEAMNRLHSEDFLKWASLAFNGLAFDVNPNKLSISEILAKQLYARVIIWPDKTVNVTSAFSPHNDESTDHPDSESQAPMPITIGTVRIENGSMNFADLWMKPNFVTGVHGLNGTIKGLSSDPSARADVFVEGKVDKYAPVKIAGQINPLSPNAYADLALSFKNMELSTLTPYSGRFVGYTIEKGKLSLDLKYELSDSILIGENKIVLNQLTLGEHVDSPEATALPVRLAIALLKDSKGKIDIDLPVRGDLNDPEFSYGRIIAKALVNMITKIVTSPFAVLGRLIGGDGEELSFVEFEFGSAGLGPEQIQKLDKLAKALHERPTLRLEVKGAAHAEYDRIALAEAELVRQLKRSRLEEMRAAGVQVPARADDVSLSDEDFSRLVIQAYVDRFGKHPDTLFATESKTFAKDGSAAPGAGQPSPSVDSGPKERPIEPRILVAAAKKRLVQDMPVNETRLRRLAQDRARQIKDHLIEKGGIPDERVFMVDVEIDDVPDGYTVRTHLTLSGD